MGLLQEQENFVSAPWARSFPSSPLLWGLQSLASKAALYQSPHPGGRAPFAVPLASSQDHNVEPMTGPRPPGSSQGERVGDIIMASPVSPGGVPGPMDGGESPTWSPPAIGSLATPEESTGVTLEQRPLSAAPSASVGVASEVPVPPEVATTTTTTTGTQYFDISSNASASRFHAKLLANYGLDSTPPFLDCSTPLLGHLSSRKRDRPLLRRQSRRTKVRRFLPTPSPTWQQKPQGRDC